MRTTDLRGRGMAIALTAFLTLAVAPQTDELKSVFSAEITVADLRAHLEAVAGDALMGRRTGSRGLDQAMQYSAEQFRQAGLEPLVPSDGAPGYFQAYPVLVTRAGDHGLISATIGDTRIGLRHGEDFVVLSAGPRRVDLDADGFVLAGYGISEPSAGWDDYAGLEIAGKVALIHAGMPQREGAPVLGDDKIRLYRGARGLENRRITASMRGARMVLFLLDDGASWEAWRESSQQLGVREDTGQEPGYPRSSRMAPMGALHPQAAARLLAALERAENQSAHGARAGSVQISLETVIERREAANVVAVVRGRDAVLRDEYVTVGSHLDHIGVRAGEIYNGADDGGSGPVALLEAAAYLAANPPRRSVIFILYSGEETGLWGSRWFVGHPPVPIESMIVNINADMVGRNGEAFPEGLHVLGANRRCAALKETLLAVNERVSGPPLNFDLERNDPQDLFNRSDHVAFHEKGLPTVFFFSGLHEDYHQPEDDIGKINFEKVRGASVLIAALARELGDRDRPICRD